jgi:hypothetical protein
MVADEEEERKEKIKSCSLSLHHTGQKSAESKTVKYQHLRGDLTLSQLLVKTSENLPHRHTPCPEAPLRQHRAGPDAHMRKSYNLGMAPDVVIEEVIELSSEQDSDGITIHATKADLNITKH